MRRSTMKIGKVIVEHMARHTARNCGSCHACCIHLTIDELQKPEHERCSHLGRTGCNQYEERPATCRDFVCLWKMGRFSKAERPDRCGVLAHLAVNELDGWGVNVVECASGALSRANGLVEECLDIECRLVTVQYLDGRKRMYSRDAVWIRDICTKNPKLPIPADSEIKWVDIRVAANGTATMHLLQK